ncbi:hypothetical protein [Catenovulum maritimum]|uniref:Endo-polygalacturonase n=1 Tax=Catenovulum maritimum TaxID=1513271 RepID=A0A0J8GR51_9ALTE|nr:hypothetical protein [Catenovulum maritimum]KMT65310.1 hypothetical protein XM47_09760 [Catenovulum maritimum]
MKNFTLYLGCIFTVSLSFNVFSVQLHPKLNPQNSSWDDTSKTITINKSVVFGNDKDKEAFYWNIPKAVKKVILGKDVTITGGFRFTDQAEITGLDRDSSIIYGTETYAWARGKNKKQDPGTSCKNGPKGDDIVHDCEKWSYGAISVIGKAPKHLRYKVSNLTIINPRTYAITSQNHAFDIDRVTILNTRIDDTQSNSDGIGGGPNTRITNTKIDTWDDAIKLYKDGMHVENVTIIHNGNGAPFQFGWSNKKPANFYLKNILVKQGIPKQRDKRYNLALFTNSGGTVSPSVTIDGLAVEYTDQTKMNIRGSKPTAMPLVYIRGTEKTKVELKHVENSPLHLKVDQLHIGKGEVKTNFKLPTLNNRQAEITGCRC